MLKLKPSLSRIDDDRIISLNLITEDVFRRRHDDDFLIKFLYEKITKKEEIERWLLGSMKLILCQI